MPLTFPSSPTNGQTYVVGSRTWTWNGSIWEFNNSAIGVSSVGESEIINGSVTQAKLASTVSGITICTSSTRPGSPFEGQMIYETNTDILAIWNGSAWKSVASTNGATFDSTGRMTNPVQPAFRYNGFSITSSGMQGGSAPLNIGSCLTIGSGATYSKFTAPVAGTYLIGGSALVDQTGGRVEIAFAKNGNQTIDGYPFYTLNQYANVSNGYSSVSGSFPFYLAANDYITMTILSGTLYSDAGRGDRMFFGYLIG
jgi:hypothetical protein